MASLAFALLTISALLLLTVEGSPIPDAPDRIVGGRTTTIEKFPYQVALIYRGAFFCGGSILSEKVILTAAHCVLDRFNKPRDKTQIQVRAGSTTLDAAAGGQQRSLAAMVAHPRYGKDAGSQLRFDAAVMRLTAALRWDAAVRPIKLVAPGSPPPRAGSTITLSGWGTLKERGSTSNVLRTVDVKVTPHDADTCSVAYKNLPGLHVTGEMFCAAEQGKDSCQGDSGGPAVDGNRRQVGIVSYGKGCADAGFSGVYTDLANKEVRNFVDNAVTSFERTLLKNGYHYATFISADTVIFS